jgi:hypothetical protein
MYWDYETFRICPAEFLGDGVAQSIKAVPLDRRRLRHGGVVKFLDLPLF